jgi:hypothetical protein
MSESNNMNSNRESSSIGEVLSGMIARLEQGNNSMLGQLRDVSQSTSSNVARLGQVVSIAAPSSATSSVGKEVLNAFNPANSAKGSNILTSLFLGPIWKGIFSLFNRDSEDQPTALTRFAAPPELRSDLAATLGPDGRVSSIRSDAFGLSQSNPAPQAPIQISIQALDARSILDRSDDIAAALKQAMLSNHEINDNLNEI